MMTSEFRVFNRLSVPTLSQGLGIQNNSSSTIAGLADAGCLADNGIVIFRGAPEQRMHQPLGSGEAEVAETLGLRMGDVGGNCAKGHQGQLGCLKILVGCSSA